MIGRTFRHLDRRRRMPGVGLRPRAGAGRRPAKYATATSAITPSTMNRAGDISAPTVTRRHPSGGEPYDDACTILKELEIARRR